MTVIKGRGSAHVLEAGKHRNMRVRIEKGAPVGTIAAPPSKSYAHRMLTCAALAAYGAPEGSVSVVYGLGAADGISEDILATVDCIRALGIGCEMSEGGITVAGISKDKGKSYRRITEQETGQETARHDTSLPTFNCRESGSTLRFFIPIAMALAGGGIFTGSRRLMQRGIDVYEELFARQDGGAAGAGASVCSPGASITREPEKITICGSLQSGEMRVRGDVSSQFISGLLYALVLLDEDSILHVQEPVESRRYIDITIDVMKMYGVTVEETAANTFHIRGRQHYISGSRAIEGDWSNAAFLYAMKYLHEGGLEIYGLDPDSMQADKICIEYFQLLDRTKTTGGDTAVLDVSNCPDLGPVLFAYAAARGGARFTGVRRLRIKESDRIACMQEELRKFGIETCSSEDEMVVYPGQLHRPSEVLRGHGDHRIVMALAVLCTLTGGEIEGAEAVAKSWPGFWKEMERLGVFISVTE